MSRIPFFKRVIKREAFGSKPSRVLLRAILTVIFVALGAALTAGGGPVAKALIDVSDAAAAMPADANDANDGGDDGGDPAVTGPSFTLLQSERAATAANLPDHSPKAGGRPAMPRATGPPTARQFA